MYGVTESPARAAEKTIVLHPRNEKRSAAVAEEPRNQLEYIEQSRQAHSYSKGVSQAVRPGALLHAGRRKGQSGRPAGGVVHRAHGSAPPLRLRHRADGGVRPRAADRGRGGGRAVGGNLRHAEGNLLHGRDPARRVVHAPEQLGQEGRGAVDGVRAAQHGLRDDQGLRLRHPPGRAGHPAGPWRGRTARPDGEVPGERARGRGGLPYRQAGRRGQDVHGDQAAQPPHGQVPADPEAARGQSALPQEPAGAVPADGLRALLRQAAGVRSHARSADRRADPRRLRAFAPGQDRAAHLGRRTRARVRRLQGGGRSGRGAAFLVHPQSLRPHLERGHSAPRSDGALHSRLFRHRLAGQPDQVHREDDRGNGLERDALLHLHRLPVRRRARRALPGPLPQERGAELRSWRAAGKWARRRGSC